MKRLLSLSFISLILIVGFFAGHAFALTAGDYRLEIQTTPTKLVGTTTTVKTVWKSGTEYNSSFSFNRVPSSGSNVMTDLDGDGLAGVIGIHVDAAGNMTTTSFQKDTILGTAGGDFSEGGTITGIGSAATADLSYNPTGRTGSITAPVMNNRPWNIDDFGGLDVNGNPVSNGNTVYGNYTSSAAGITNGSGTVPGTPVYTDSNGDMWATLVSGGTVGSAWGSFFGAQYFEVWKVQIVAVPEPGSLLLIGSGLVGLIGLARKRNKK